MSQIHTPCATISGQLARTEFCISACSEDLELNFKILGLIKYRQMFCCNILLTAILFLAKNHMTFLGLHKSKNLITLFYSLVSKAGIKSRNSSVRIVVGFFFFSLVQIRRVLGSSLLSFYLCLSHMYNESSSVMFLH